ncbi:Gamma-tubulin complex component 4 [Erysiphe neolycopersici]|uniref:Spindle pole body component n=1 Tax=Erysiphe neolycopersici TaxID=212602 RepID=A0A420I5H7_9PEZI|nr:Gamma-tubulin complex component 4 [Erysiphe neolycopersici]
MLHEILLSLSGHSSPLLNNDYSSSSSILSPPEKALLATIGNLSNLHCKLLAQTSKITATHDSGVCQAVATAIRSKYLSKFQRKVLEVEDSLLPGDKIGSNMTKDYNKIPLTALVGEFSGWTRVMEWLLQITELINCVGSSLPSKTKKCSGAKIIDHLCREMQTGYLDVKEVAKSLLTAAETAWLKQLSNWVLYGRLPSFGRDDFFVQTVTDKNLQEFEVKKELLPAFVSDSTAGSILFIGRSLNQIWEKRSLGAKSPELHLLPMHLQQISSLSFPISGANFSRAISTIRLSLSQKILKSLLPLARVNRILSLLRELFLLGRGEFAIALVTEADEQMRLRWRQSKSFGFESQDKNVNILPKEGEVSAVLARTWAALSAMQGQHDENLEEDEVLELARDLVQLTISKPSAPMTHYFKNNSIDIYSKISSTPFKNLLLSTPTSLTMTIPSPLDLFLTPADIQVYSCINAYLLSIRRAHLRLTDLWKITAMRRHYPVSINKKFRNTVAGAHLIRMHRKKINERFSAMRSVWATSSAALFFLSETEAYFQGEVVQSMWLGFKDWINGDAESASTEPGLGPNGTNITENQFLQIYEKSNPSFSNGSKSYDPQSLADAHQRYLSALASGLLLTISAFTHPLYHFLQQIDHLVALVHRIYSIWQSLDLEADEGVVDAFSDFHKEEKDTKLQLQVVAAKVKKCIENLIINGLRDIVQDQVVWDNTFTEFAPGQESQNYVPVRVGRIDRLLMKLDFGGWFDDENMKKRDININDYFSDEDE